MQLIAGCTSGGGGGGGGFLLRKTQDKDFESPFLETTSFLRKGLKKGGLSS